MTAEVYFSLQLKHMNETFSNQSEMNKLASICDGDEDIMRRRTTDNAMPSYDI